MPKLFLSFAHVEHGSPHTEFGNLVVDANEPSNELDIYSLEHRIKREKNLKGGWTKLLYFQVMRPE